jgi:hypothetical protein
MQREVITVLVRSTKSNSPQLSVFLAFAAFEDPERAVGVAHFKYGGWLGQFTAVAS